MDGDTSGDCHCDSYRFEIIVDFNTEKVCNHGFCGTGVHGNIVARSGKKDKKIKNCQRMYSGMSKWVNQCSLSPSRKNGSRVGHSLHSR
jgi:hypothetical protein